MFVLGHESETYINIGLEKSPFAPLQALRAELATALHDVQEIKVYSQQPVGGVPNPTDIQEFQQNPFMEAIWKSLTASSHP